MSALISAAHRTATPIECAALQLFRQSLALESGARQLAAAARELVLVAAADPQPSVAAQLAAALPAEQLVREPAGDDAGGAKPGERRDRAVATAAKLQPTANRSAPRADAAKRSHAANAAKRPTRELDLAAANRELHAASHARH